MKKIIPAVIIISTVLLLFSGCSFFGGGINLPDTDVISRVEFGELLVTNQDDIEIIMSALSGARRVSRNAMNDHPFGRNILMIYPYRSGIGEDILSARLFLFVDNDGNEYLWNSYVGVYKISQENIDVVRNLYDDLKAR
jgi:hypothetical protein